MSTGKRTSDKRDSMQLPFTITEDCLRILNTIDTVYTSLVLSQIISFVEVKLEKYDNYIDCIADAIRYCVSNANAFPHTNQLKELLVSKAISTHLRLELIGLLTSWSYKTDLGVYSVFWNHCYKGERHPPQESPF